MEPANSPGFRPLELDFKFNWAPHNPPSIRMLLSAHTISTFACLPVWFVHPAADLNVCASVCLCLCRLAQRESLSTGDGG